MYVFKPAPVVSLFDPGVNPYSGITTWLEAHRQNPFFFRPTSDATGLLRFGNFSGAWALQVIGPLLIIVLGFSAFAVEREQGTLRQVLSLGVGPRQLLWGKALSLATVALALLLPVALALLIAGGATHGGADLAKRILVLVFGYLLYLGMFLFLSLAVSAWCRSSRIALLILLALWIVNVMLAPRATNDLARHLYPLESQYTFAKAYSEGIADAYKQVFKQLNAERWADIPSSKFGLSLAIAEKYERANADRHFNRLWDTLAGQNLVQQWSSILSPMLAVRSVSASMAATDMAHWQNFAAAAERYRRSFETLVNADNAKNGGDLGYNYKADAALWSRVEPFHYDLPSFAWALRNALPGLIILISGFLLSMLLAFSATRQLSV
jgi:ABC-2 type transport system permease protein